MANSMRRQVHVDVLHARKIGRLHGHERAHAADRDRHAGSMAATDSTIASASSCRVMRPRPAPTASRTAISRRRVDARASCRFDTLRQAITSSTTAAPNSISSIGRAVAVSLLAQRHGRGIGHPGAVAVLPA